MVVNTRPKRALGGTQVHDNLLKTNIAIGDYKLELGTVEYVEKGFNMLYVYVGAGTSRGPVLCF